MYRLLNVLVVLTTLGSVLMVFDQVRAFGASVLTSAGIVGLVAGVAAQRTLQNAFGGLQLVSNPNAGTVLLPVRNRGLLRDWLAGWERFEIGSYNRGPIGAVARSVSMVLSISVAALVIIEPSPWTARPNDPV